MEVPPKKFYRLSPGQGGPVALRLSHHLPRNREGCVGRRSSSCAAPTIRRTRGGNAPDGRKVQATLHWVGAADSVPAEIRLYDNLFRSPDPGAAGDILADINPASLEILRGARVEPALAALAEGEAVQFERQGYYCRDADSTPDHLVFNRTVGLRDSWAKAQAGQPPAPKT